MDYRRQLHRAASGASRRTRSAGSRVAAIRDLDGWGLRRRSGRAKRRVAPAAGGHAMAVLPRRPAAVHRILRRCGASQSRRLRPAVLWPGQNAVMQGEWTGGLVGRMCGRPAGLDPGGQRVRVSSRASGGVVSGGDVRGHVPSRNGRPSIPPQVLNGLSDFETVQAFACATEE